MSKYTFKANETVFLNHKNVVSTIDGDVANNAIPIPSYKLFKEVYDELSAADQTVSAAFVDADKKLSGEFKAYANSISAELSNIVTNKGYVIYNEQYFNYNTDTHELSLTFVTDNNRTHSIVFDTDELKINSVISTMQIVTVTSTDGTPEYDALRIWWEDANSKNQCCSVDIRLDKLAQIYTEGEGITIDKSLDGKGRFVVSVNNYNTITSDVSNLKVDTTNISSHTLDIQSYVNKLSAQNGIISTLNNDIKTAQTTANIAQSSADEISADVIIIQNYVDDLQKADGIIQTIKNDITDVNRNVNSLSSKHIDELQDTTNSINDLEQHVEHIQSYVNELSVNNGTIDVIENNIDDLSSKHILELANIQTDVNTISSDTTAIKSYINELSINNGTIDVIENNIDDLSTKHISELANIQTDVNTISSDTNAIKLYVNELSTNDGVIDSLMLNDSIMSNDISTLFKEIRHDLTITGHLLSLDTRFESGTKTLSAILTEYNLGETGTIKNGSIVDVTLADVSSEYTTTDGVKLCNGDIIIIHDHTDTETVELVSLTTVGDNKNTYIIHTDVTRHEFATLSSTVSTLTERLNSFDMSIITAINNSINTLDLSVKTIDTTIDTINTSINTLDLSVKTIDTTIDTINTSINTLDLSVKTIDTTIDTINTSINTLDSNIDSKIFIKELETNTEAYTNLSIIEIDQNEYDELIITNNLISNALYLVDADYINAYDSTIQNLVMTDDDVPSEATNKHYVDTLYSNLTSNVDSQIFIENIDGTHEYTNLSIIHIQKADYDEQSIEGTLLSNALYIISSDYIDAEGEIIKNLTMTDNDVASEAVNKDYVDTLYNSLNTQIMSLTEMVNDINTILETI